MKIVSSAEAAVAQVKSGDRVFVHGACATPLALLDALVADAARLRDVELIHLHTVGPARYADPEFRGHFRVANLFVGSNMRPKLDYEHVDYLPLFLSEIPALFRSGRRMLDVALIHVSPPDRHGYCSLGTSVDATVAAVESAKLVIAQINPNMPRLHGDGILHVDDFSVACEVDTPIPELPTKPIDDVTRQIGENVAGLIEDGAALQMGIGVVPDAVLAALRHHRHLGIHTEMWSDGALDLIERGVVDNSRKKIHPGVSISSFLIGTRRLYDFVDDNPSVRQLDCAYVNNPAVIARNDRVCAINGALEVDLTGQVCADSIGNTIFSGVGGQMDFIRGASLSRGGKPIIALPSTTRGRKSRLVSRLNPGAGVVTTRAHVHYVVTEYGVADLYGKTLRERATALIDIAHPEHREELERDWHEIHGRG